VTGDQVVEKRDIIVMGGSAGGIEAYCEILRGLPWDLAASVFVAQHVGSKSVLADVLRRCAALQLLPMVRG
jgi:two-component system chemotaxis response regulator CheB